MATVGVPAQTATPAGNNFFTRDSIARTILFCLVLASAVIAVYLPVHSHPYFNLDDPKYVIQNPHIQGGLTPSVMVWAVTHGYAANWHPLTWWSHALDISVFGMDPAGAHDENMVLHALNAVLLFLVLKRATGYAGRSFMVAALFGLHPLNVESVAWIAERKTLLSTMFCILALGAYDWYTRQPSMRRYLTMAGLFVLGLMSKPQIIMLPLVLLLWDYWPLGRMEIGVPAEGLPAISTPRHGFQWLFREKIPLFVICILDAVMTMVAQHTGGAKQPYTLWLRLENAAQSYVRYVFKAFWPSNLAVYYPHPGKTISTWQSLAAFALLIAITVLAAKAKQYKYLIVGWLWFLIMLIPMIGLVQVDVQGWADRYAYVSFIGLFLMVCWGLADWAAERHLPRAALPAVSLLALVALAVVTNRQVNFWQDDVTIWAHSAEVSPGNWKAQYWLAISLDSEARQDEAITHYLAASAINPTDPFTNQNIAGYEQRHGNFPMAVEYYKKVVPQAWTPEMRASALNGMASAYRAMGDNASADECLAKMQTQPKKAVDWQGAWWQQIIPMIKQYFHGSSQ